MACTAGSRKLLPYTHLMSAMPAFFVSRQTQHRMDAQRDSRRQVSTKLEPLAKRPVAPRALGYKYSLELAQLHAKQHAFLQSELQAARYFAADQIDPRSHITHSNAASTDIQLSLAPASAALMGSEPRK